MNVLCEPVQVATRKKCEHGKHKYYCRDCKGAGICEHGKVKSHCKNCGGSAFCEHGKLKSRCQGCGGSELCEHEKRKSHCKICLGSAFCEHGKHKSRCVYCGGSELCEHGKRKSYCKNCLGSAFCEHGKQKAQCKQCFGTNICEHGKYKPQCKQCFGSSICEHGKLKAQCKQCFGASICEHGKLKSQCRNCGGTAFCEHGRRKSHCKNCGGSAFCEHGKLKSYCRQCGGSSLCKNEWCETTRSTKYEGFCFPCFVNNPENQDKPLMCNYKTKEKDTVDRIKETFNDLGWVADKRVVDGCSRRRPDLLLDICSHIIIVEIDENKHNDYDCSCENKRLMELSQDLQHRPIVFIRFNPDGYINQDGILVKSCWKLNKGVMQIVKTKQKEWDERIEILKQQIQYWIDNPTVKTVEIIELFY